jgi:hypothetical protein
MVSKMAENTEVPALPPAAEQVLIKSQALSELLTQFAEITSELDRFPGLSLAKAGLAYADLAIYAVQEAAHSRAVLMPLYKAMPKPQSFPYGNGWKPENPRADMLKAAAMLLAEVHKMDEANMGGRVVTEPAPCQS